MRTLQVDWNSFRENNSEWAHMGVKAFKFERAALALELKVAFFGVHCI